MSTRTKNEIDGGAGLGCVDAQDSPKSRKERAAVTCDHCNITEVRAANGSSSLLCLPPTGYEIRKIARRTVNIIVNHFGSKNICLLGRVGSAASALWADIKRVPNVRASFIHGYQW
jgi:hypothetical protein